MKPIITSLFLTLASLTFSQSDSISMALGEFSVSLTVKDIAKSRDFYQKLGFVQLTEYGSIEDKWLIMQNGTTVIGLFQDMFPVNSLTFNPTDARSIYHKLEKDGLEFVSSEGIEKAEGPCYFTLLDPDGNPVLIDQHY